MNFRPFLGRIQTPDVIIAYGLVELAILVMTFLLPDSSALARRAISGAVLAMALAGGPTGLAILVHWFRTTPEESRREVALRAEFALFMIMVMLLLTAGTVYVLVGAT